MQKGVVQGLIIITRQARAKQKQVIEVFQEDPRVQESNKAAADARRDSRSTRRGTSHPG